MSDQKKTADKSLEGLSMRERNELLAEQKEQRRWRNYGIIAAVVAVLIAALLFWDHGFIQSRATALTIGDRNYTAADVDYYYFSQYNSIYPYASYYGLDTSKSLRDQQAYDGQTWYEYLRSNAESSLKEISTLAQEGEAEGYTISENAQKDLDKNLQDARDEAKKNNVSLSYYLHRMFGRFMTWNRFEKLVTEQYYANDYRTHKTESFEVTEDELNKYYTDHKAEMDTYTYQAYQVNVDAGTDENGNEKEATQEQIDEAKAKAEKLEAALKAGDQTRIDTLVSELGAVSLSDVSSSSLSSYAFGSWLTDEARKAGETTVIENSHTEEVESDQADTDADASTSADASAAASVDTADTAATSAAADASAPAAEKETVTHIDGYYAVRFDSRALDEYKAVNVLSVTVPAKELQTAAQADSSADSSAAADAAAADDAPSYDMEGAKADADAFVEQWQSQGGTEQALRDLTTTEEPEEAEDEEESKADSSAAAEGKAETYVLTESKSVDKLGSAYNSEVMSWLYDTEHKAGDYTVVSDNSSNCYRLIFVQGYDEEPYWKVSSRKSVQSEKYTDWYDGLGDKYTPKETWFYSQVG